VSALRKIDVGKGKVLLNPMVFQYGLKGFAARFLKHDDGELCLISQIVS
jgi:hypothetical protein